MLVKVIAPRSLGIARVETNRNRGGDILREQDPLSLNDEKVDELVDIANHGIERLLRDRVVPPRAKLSRKTIVHESLSSDLRGDCDGKDHPCKLEGPPEDIEVPNREDQRHDGRVCNPRSACIPYQYKRLFRPDARKLRALTRIVP